MRLAWLLGGLVCAGIGLIGVIVPGLPTTVFMILAAWCFSKSSPRLEQWVLEMPGIGPMVADFRAGLGMPKRTKVLAISCIAAAVALSTLFLIKPTWVRLLVLAVGLAGVSYILWLVPTRETILASREDNTD